MLSNLRKAVLATLVCGLAVCPVLAPTLAQDRGSMSTKETSSKKPSATRSEPSVSVVGSKSLGEAAIAAKPSGAKATQTKSKPQQEAAPVKAADANVKVSASSTKSASSSKGSTSGLRLPRYFSGIIDQEQREQIHAIQLEYRTKIEELEKELARVRQDEMQAVEKVLTESQRKLLDKKRAQSRSKTMEADSTESM